MRSFRCLLGLHRWSRDTASAWRPEWLCERCGATPKECSNCGGQHDPTALLTVCSVTR